MLCLKTPSSARERAVFRLAKLVPSDAEGTEAGDIGFIVDGAPDVHRDNQTENKSLEARSSFQKEHSESASLPTFHSTFLLSMANLKNILSGVISKGK